MKCNGIIFAAVLILSVSMVQLVYAQDNNSVSFREVLKENRYQLRLEDGELTGPGGELFVENALKADILTLGESHGTKEIPNIIRALLGEMQSAGEFDQLAIEVSPWTAQQLENNLQEGEEAYNKFISAYTSAVPYYSWKAERDLLHQVVGEESDERTIVGMDQIFSFSADWALNRLKKLAPDGAIRSKVNGVAKSLDRRAEKNAKSQQIPKALPAPITMFQSSTIDSLQVWFDEVSEAKQILDEIERSIRVYKLNDSNNYRANQIRAKLMRENLSRAMRSYAAKNGDISGFVIKTGAMHAYRGMTPNNALDVGNLAVSMADIRGEKAFNVAILCGPGSKGRGFPGGTSSCWPGFLGKELKSLSKGSAVLFDLSSLHPLLHEKKINPPKKLAEFLWAFDAVVLIPDATPASYTHPIKE